MGRGRPSGQRWCILRCAPARTLKLAGGLRQAGLGAWTPVETVSRRVTRVRRRLDQPSPLLAGLVFAPARHLEDLLDIAAAPFSRHPGFHVFRHADGIPLVSDADLAPLREAERRARRARQPIRLHRGDEIRMAYGAWAGLEGKVVEVNGRHALVLYRGFRIPVKIVTSNIGEDEILNPQPQGTAA